MTDDDRPPVLAHVRFAADRAAFAGLDLAARFARIAATGIVDAAIRRAYYPPNTPGAAR